MEFFVEPGTRRGVARVLARASAGTGTSTSACARRTCASTSTRKEKLSHYSKRTVDIEYRFQLRRHGVRRARGHRQPHRLRPDRALQALRRRPVLLRPGEGRALDAVRHRAGGRPRPARCSPSCSTPTPRTRRPTPRASWRSARSCASTRGSRRSRSRCCRCRATPTCRRRPATSPPQLRQRWNVEFDDARRDRPPLPPPGRDRHAVLRHRRLRHPRRQRGDGPRARHDDAGAGRASTRSRATWPSACLGC